MGRIGGLLVAAVAGIVGADDAPGPIVLTVEAGRFDRRDTPVWVELPAGTLPADGPSAVRLVEEGSPSDTFRVAQVDRNGDSVRLTWILDGPTPAGSRRRFRLDPAPIESPTPWSWTDRPGTPLALAHGDRPVFAYNRDPVARPEYAGQERSAYIHPAYAPSGALVTGDYSARSHPHHRGIFLAYARAEVGALKPDFWNIHTRTGRITCVGVDSIAAGPIAARFAADHDWEAIGPGGGVVLRERWEVEAIDRPGSSFWLIDLTSTQRAVGATVRLPAYRYGGMAYRGPDPFFPRGVLDVLTSEGLDRVKGDQKPARWVDLTGPVADGSDHYAGVAVLDHPANPGHPTPARIHPTTIPFVCFTPAHDRPIAIDADRPIVFRYRLLIHDGRPDAEMVERAWRDFAKPPVVTVRRPPSPVPAR